MRINKNHQKDIFSPDFFKSNLVYNNGEIADLIRPNKFYVTFYTNYENFDPDNNEHYIGSFVKSFTIPPMTKSFVTIKRMGKTIKIPRNNDISDNVSIKFHADTNAKTLSWLSNVYYMGENRPLTSQSKDKLYGVGKDRVKWTMVVYGIQRIWTPKGELKSEYEKDPYTFSGIAKSFVPTINTPLGNINIFKNEVKKPEDLFDVWSDTENIFVMKFDDIFISELQLPEFDYSNTSSLSEFNATFGFANAYFGKDYVTDIELRTYDKIKEEIKEQIGI